MALPYNATPFATWQIAGPYRPKTTLERLPAALVFEQDWMGSLTTFEAGIPAMDTAHPTIPGVYLVSVGTPKHLGGGIGQATFTYAQIPEPRDEWNTSISYTFPGGSGTFSGEINVLVQGGIVLTQSTLPILGTARTREVLGRMRYDYWLPGQTEGIVTAADIPIVPEFIIADENDALTTILSSTTTPSLTDYEEYVALAHEIVAQRSILRPWLGNIIERMTVYVKAQ